jgi:tyrosyl-tRNA synthetase
MGEDLPSVSVPAAELAAGIPAFELFRRAGLAASNSEARRLIKGGGARINDAKLDDEAASIGAEAVGAGGVIKLSAGRKRHALVKPS